MLRLDNVGISNNEQFSKLETQIIRHHLEEAEVDLDRIDVEIAELIARKRKINDKIRRYRVAIAPHKKLPEDMIRCIFACLAQDCAICFPYYRDNIPPQVVLSHVCLAWRQIVLSMDSLWSHITVIPQNNFRVFCETWSLRITGRLTVDLALADPYTNSGLPRKDLWDPLLHFQFKEIEFVMDNVQLCQLREMPDDVSLQAERVALVIKVYDQGTIKVQYLPLFISRLLYSFRICPAFDDEECGYFDPEDFPLPWSQLRCLELSGIQIHLSRFIRLLERCTSLEACSMEVCPARDVDVMPAEQVTLMFLQKLTVIARPLRLDALSCLLLPNLRILEIRGGEWTDKVHAVFRNQFNFQQLRELNITHIKCPPSVISILKDAPSLRRLCLPQDAVFDEESLRGLTNGQLGRHLESLEVFDSSCNVDDMVKVVETRREARKVVAGPAPFLVRAKSM